MNSTRRVIAATQALLIFPAILFMCALILRQMSPLQHEPACMSQQIVLCGTREECGHCGCYSSRYR